MGCKMLCTCQNGQHACSTLCPQEDRRPSRLHCRAPKLVEIQGQCCKEWTCPLYLQRGSHSNEESGSAGKFFVDMAETEDHAMQSHKCMV